MPQTIDKSEMSPQQTDLLARVEHRLMAPCCYTQTIDLHMSDIAEKMRHEVATMILGGQTERQMYDHYKALYGEQILAVPDGALGVTAFAIPTTVSTLATGALAFFLYRIHRRKLEVLRISNPSALGTTISLSSSPDSDESKALRERIRAETAW
jgi:cytochrome c-type biogenesis protein CcmH/NrfF